MNPARLRREARANTSPILPAAERMESPVPKNISQRGEVADPPNPLGCARAINPDNKVITLKAVKGYADQSSPLNQLPAALLGREEKKNKIKKIIIQSAWRVYSPLIPSDQPSCRRNITFKSLKIFTFFFFSPFHFLKRELKGSKDKKKKNKTVLNWN